MLYVITGVERLLMDQKIQSLKKDYPITSEELNYIKLDCREHSCNDLITEITSAPFFSEYRMVVLTHPYFLTTEKGRNEKQEDIDALVSALCMNDESLVAIIFYEGKLDERKKTTKKIRAFATNLDFPHPDANKLRASTRAAFKARKTIIDDAALTLLIERAGENLLKIQSEVEKLCLYTNHVTLEDVSKLVTKPIEENAFELTNALLKKDFTKTMEIYHDLMTKNEEPIRLISLLANSLRTLYQVKLLDRKGYNDQEIAKYLDMNPYRLRYIRMDTKNFELNDLMDMISHLSQLDLQIKRGQIDRFLGLELFFIQSFRK